MGSPNPTRTNGNLPPAPPNAAQRLKIDTYETAVPKTPTKLSRKAPPADEQELMATRSSSPPTKPQGDAFAEMKNLVGNELDEIMASAEKPGPVDHLFLTYTLDEETSPLHISLPPLVTRVESPHFSTPPEENAWSDSTLEFHFDLASNGRGHTAVSHSNHGSSPVYSTPSQDQIGQDIIGYYAAADPAAAEARPPNALTNLNEQDRPQLSLKTSPNPFEHSNFYGLNVNLPSLSSERQSFGSVPTDTRSASTTTPRMFSAASFTESTKLDPVPLNTQERFSGGLYNDILRIPESIYSENLELPVDSFADSAMMTVAPNGAALRNAFGNTAGLLMEPSRYFDSEALSPDLGHASSRPLRPKLQLLMAWANSSNSFSDTLGNSNSIRKSHTRVLSTSSILSHSSRHVNLATIKRSLSLRPGEGERSHYVTAIRKSAGTSYNETGPGKWKLPLGITPLDSKTLALLTYSQGSTRFSRGSSSLASRSKKTSGVELKHGHLQARLLASEVDEVGETNRFGALGRSSTLQNKTAISPVVSVGAVSATKSGTTSNGISRAGSITRSSTVSARDTETLENGSGIDKSRRGSTTSFVESVDSVGDRVDAYYQHQGYRYGETEDEYNNYNEDIAENYDDEDEAEEKPHLVLANPDSSSDNE